MRKAVLPLCILIFSIFSLLACTQPQPTPTPTPTPTPIPLPTPTLSPIPTATPTPTPTVTPRPVAYFLEIKPTEGGRIDVSPPPDQDGGYKPGTVVRLHAIAESGFSFHKWAGDAGGGTENPLTLTVRSNLTVGAFFEKTTVAQPTVPPLPSCPLTRSPRPVSRPHTPSPPAAGPVSLKVVGQIGGPVRAIAAQGNYAYVGVGMRLVVLDVSDSKAPREVGATESLGGFVEDIVLAEALAFVAAGEAGLYIVDIADPARPPVVGAYNTPGYSEGVAVTGRYTYVADGPGGLRIMDIGDPARPREIGFAYSLNYIFDVAVSGQYAYLAAAGAGLLVADVSNPARPVELGRYGTPGYAYGVTASGTTAYVADGWGGLRLIDIANPREPKEVAFHDSPGWAFDVAIGDDIAYLADAFASLQVIDVRDRTKPTLLGSYRVPGGHAEGVAVSGGMVYVADRNLGLHIVDVGTSAQPRRVGLYSPMGFADGVAVAGKYAYVAAGRYGFRVVDLSDPSRPREVGSFDTQNNAWTVTAAGNVAYVSAVQGPVPPRFFVLDVSDPTHPTGSFYDLGPGRAGTTEVRDQVVDQGILYLGTEAVVHIVDISDLLSPCRLSSLDSALVDPKGPRQYGEPVGVAASGNIAYVAVGVAGMWTVDVSDPRRPTLLGVYDEPPPGTKASTGVAAEDVVVAGNFAYLLDRDNLRVVDVSDPKRPKGVGFYPLPAGVLGTGPFLAVAGSIVYVANGAAGLVAVDVSDPANPRLAERVRLPGHASAVAVDDTYVYVAAETGGLFIIQRTTGSGSRSAPSTTEFATGSPLDGALALPAQGMSAQSARPTGLSGLWIPEQRGESPQHLMVRLPSASSAPHSVVRQQAPLSGSICTVTSAADSGPGTLRWCMEQARSGDTITFDPVAFPPKNPTTIKLVSGLPSLQGSMTIDGSDAGVVLDGSSAPPGTSGLYIGSQGNVVKGLQILRFPAHGVSIGGAKNTIGGDRSRGAGPLGEGNVISGNKESGIFFCCGEQVQSNRVIGNFIGLDASGKAVLANGGSGMVVAHVDNNLIGGAAPADRNVITGNKYSEVYVKGASGNAIVGNYIGTDVTGQVNLSSTSYWTVAVEGGSPNNRIDGNVIAGGVLIFDSGSSYNEVIGNYIGLDASGTTVLGHGVVLMNQPFNKIGGTTPKERNVISGGVSIALGATDNLILGNFLGTDATGTRPLSGGGVSISGRHNFVGGATKEEGNVLAGGVSLGAGSNNNFIAGNFIGADATGTAAFPNFVGISLEAAEHNAIQGNLTSGGSEAGIRLGNGANFNWLRNNHVTNNKKYGIEVAEAKGNRIVGNSFVKNGLNGYDGGRNNFWDDGAAGNYWSDYTGKDANGDGVGDTPFPVPPNGVDRYPVMVPPL